MITNCQFILENHDFDYIDDELINSRLHCMNPHYEHGQGCYTCPIYRQLFEVRGKIYNEEEN